MKNYACIHTHTHYSLLDSLIKPSNLASYAAKLEIPAVALTDHGNIAACIQFQTAMKTKGIKPILGCEFYISSSSSKDKRDYTTITLLAKNLTGWRQIVAATNLSNTPELFFKVPRLDIGQLSGFADGNVIATSGHVNTALANSIFSDPKIAYLAENESDISSLTTNAGKRITAVAKELQEIFGQGNFYIEVPALYNDRPWSKFIIKAMRWVSKHTGIPAVAMIDPHYLHQEDWRDHHILICKQLRETRAKVESRLHLQEDPTLRDFFHSDKYYLATPEEISFVNTEEEIENTLRIADLCEDYKITNKPNIPKFSCPNNLSSEQYLRELCVVGWQERIAGKITCDKKAEYGNRVRQELDLFNSVGLADYFLMVQDIVNWARNNDITVGAGRGSAAGCLISFLLKITSVDPILYDLMLERFYNSGRNTADYVSMPDIDIDFEAGKRGKVINYCREKYGRDRVCQMVTYHRMQGRTALRIVMESLGYDEGLKKNITEPILDEAKIAGDLQEMRDSGEEDVTGIRWALENRSKQLEPYCKLNSEGELVGEYAPVFAAAMRLEGIKRARSRHASGIIISTTDLNVSAPMILDETTNEHIIGVEMGDVEKLGFVKLDLLGIAALEKLRGVQDLVRYGRFLSDVSSTD